MWRDRVVAGMTMDLADVAQELYGLDPGEFVAARDARSRELRAADRDLAAQIKRLKRASTAAWVVNMFVRRHPDETGGLAELGATLREAQGRGDGALLRALVPERRRAVSSASELAREVAARLGHPLTTATSREVESTLDAALADERAMAAVGSGVLLRSLEQVGDEVDLAGATAVDVAVASTAPRLRPASLGSASEPPPDPADVLAQATSTLAAATAARVAAEHRRVDAASAVSRLEDELARARAEAGTAAAELRQAQDVERRAQKALDAATRRVDRHRP